MTPRTFHVCFLLFAAAFMVAPTMGQDSLLRGPYLQSGTQNSIVVRWRTPVPTDARVRFGTAVGSLNDFVDNPTPSFDHEITLLGLVAGTRYFYSVGTTTDVLIGDDADHFFVTSPSGPGLEPTRIWIIGDSGTAHQQQLNPEAGEVRDAQDVRDAYLRYAGLGDAIVTAGATWRYLDDGADQGTAWQAPAFDDSGWSAGPGELSYGDDDEATVVNCGPSAPLCDSGNFITTYFRHSFNVADASAYRSLTLSLLRDDGALAYLNGTEVMRTNMPAGPVDSTTTASSVVFVTEHVFHRVAVDVSLLVDGNNVLAVEVHQFLDTSSDISLHAELFAQTRAGVHTELWLMLGDNAYNVGSEVEWQRAAFDPYASLLRSTVLWPVLGNHDILTLDPNPYLEAMTLPTMAEAGGVSSGTEEYYSFNYSNVHFVALDSTHPASRQPGSAMLTWLESDLAATFQNWIIALWHHPPYSKGSHNSDAEDELVEMRENVLPILEAGGVDLVLAGHSHSYERSMLIDGFYATPTLIDDGTVLDENSGDPFTDGFYGKSGPGPIPNEGAVYSVVGSSGRNSPTGGNLDHPVMFFSLHDLGSLVVDIDDNRLDATFINRNCSEMGDPACEQDSFTLVKGTPRAAYVRVTTDRQSIAPGESLPYQLRLENVTNTIQGYVFGLFLQPPTGPGFFFFAQPLIVPPQFELSAPLSLPLPIGVAAGDWQLFAVAFTFAGNLIDASRIEFEVL